MGSDLAVHCFFKILNRERFGDIVDSTERERFLDAFKIIGAGDHDHAVVDPFFESRGVEHHRIAAQEGIPEASALSLAAMSRSAWWQNPGLSIPR